jgi:hypothetical protein
MNMATQFMGYSPDAAPDEAIARLIGHGDFCEQGLL